MYSNCAITSFKYLKNIRIFSRILEVFNEMEMEREMSLIIRVSQFFFKNKSKRITNFIICHFLVESKPYERIDLLITASINIYQTKKKYSNSNENMLF